MEIRGVSEGIIRRAAESIGSTCENWRATRHGFAFVIRPVGAECMYRTHSARGRRVNAVCWHGHKVFMDEIFQYA